MNRTEQTPHLQGAYCDEVVSFWRGQFLKTVLIQPPVPHSTSTSTSILPTTNC